MKTYVTLVYHRINPWGDDWTDTVVYAGPDKKQAIVAGRITELVGHVRIQVWVDGKLKDEEQH